VTDDAGRASRCERRLRRRLPRRRGHGRRRVVPAPALQDAVRHAPLRLRLGAGLRARVDALRQEAADHAPSNRAGARARARRDRDRRGGPATSRDHGASRRGTAPGPARRWRCERLLQRRGVELPEPGSGRARTRGHRRRGPVPLVARAAGRVPRGDRMVHGERVATPRPAGGPRRGRPRPLRRPGEAPPAHGRAPRRRRRDRAPHPGGALGPLARVRHGRGRRSQGSRRPGPHPHSGPKATANALRGGRVGLVLGDRVPVRGRSLASSPHGGAAAARSATPWAGARAPGRLPWADHRDAPRERPERRGARGRRGSVRRGRHAPGGSLPGPVLRLAQVRTGAHGLASRGERAETEFEGRPSRDDRVPRDLRAPRQSRRATAGSQDRPASGRGLVWRAGCDRSSDSAPGRARTALRAARELDASPGRVQPRGQAPGRAATRSRSRSRRWDSVPPCASSSACPDPARAPTVPTRRARAPRPRPAPRVSILMPPMRRPRALAAAAFALLVGSLAPTRSPARATRPRPPPRP
jgi:hypothetical protein